MCCLIRQWLLLELTLTGRMILMSARNMLQLYNSKKTSILDLVVYVLSNKIAYRVFL